MVGLTEAKRDPRPFLSIEKEGGIYDWLLLLQQALSFADLRACCHVIWRS